jgi:hypothetical protein
LATMLPKFLGKVVNDPSHLAVTFGCNGHLSNRYPSKSLFIDCETVVDPLMARRHDLICSGVPRTVSIRYCHP